MVSNETKVVILKAAIKIVKGSPGNRYMCPAIIIASRNILGDTKCSSILKDNDSFVRILFPEMFKKYGPKHMSKFAIEFGGEYGCGWFDAETLAPRIKILNSLIEDTEKLIKEDVGEIPA